MPQFQTCKMSDLLVAGAENGVQEIGNCVKAGARCLGDQVVLWSSSHGGAGVAVKSLLVRGALATIVAGEALSASGPETVLCDAGDGIVLTYVAGLWYGFGDFAGGYYEFRLYFLEEKWQLAIWTTDEDPLLVWKGWKAYGDDPRGRFHKQEGSLTAEDLDVLTDPA